ncbi:NnrU family protein [Accumulibacter sp.]|uniref:NnrU family protein n=1 Tax=Accumulibacter sp. TaxID=2053492 RepID=UPI002621AFFC|nr:NnrU family protein [Accumulibacter sp.]
MITLVLGLVIFLGVHSLRIFADGWRSQVRTRIGVNAWKGGYSLLSLLGFGLLVWGYGQARLDPVQLWTPMIGTRHLAALLMLPSFILLAGAYVPQNGIKARVHHPMVLAVKVWALAHLLANHTLADLVLFGSLLVWSVLDFRSSRQRDRAAGTVYPAGTLTGSVATVAVGAVAWAVFAFWAHAWLFGVRPFG